MRRISGAAIASRPVVLADDLTGAADASVVFFKAGFPTTVTTRVSALEEELVRATVVGLDLGTRGDAAPVAYLAAYEAATRIRQSGALIYKKVDSQLRGHPGPELEGVLDAYPDCVAIVAPALPALGRVVRDGRLQGVSADRACLLADVFSPRPGGCLQLVGLDELRQGQLGARLTGLGPGSLVLADSLEQGDLDALVAAGRRVHHPIVWVGSAGLATAVANSLASGDGRAIFPRHHDSKPTPPGETAVGVLVAAASREPVVGEQVNALIGAAVCELAVDLHRVRDWLDLELPAIALDLAAGRTVVLRSPVGSPLLGERADYAWLIARAAKALVEETTSVGLVATGGEAARCLLDVIDEQRCDIVQEVEPSMPLMVTRRRGLGLVTKAGSFGTALSLVKAVEALRAWQEGERPDWSGPPVQKEVL
jgi:uncharacterized protein YgbK (DUF1537 family)